MSVDRELAGLEEAVAMAQASFDEAVALRNHNAAAARIGMGVCQIELGAARAVLTAMRLRLIARLHAARLPPSPPPALPRLTPPR